ncbi:MAG: energy transducer TonB [Prevotella sp.]|jgi:TonB family protein|nr:energy transducer TonB [Prevotella sp.]
MTKGKKKNNVIKEIRSIEQQLYGKAMMIVGISLLLTLSSCEKDDDDIDDPEPVTEIVDETVDQMASYPGGIPALMDFLNENIKYPEQAEREGIEGRVVAGFIVERDGSVSNIEILKSVHPLLDAEVVRVMSLMPNWIPGRQNGQPVRVKYSLPITFRLISDNESSNVKIQ